ncbi:g3373 [Coccomyxa viridis]|uniref:G3373 protein n=1 Tax=Coccomyxa viridis TaxID=1274662 RepID=A0ABP1FUJ4_9CHLO
MSIYTVGEYWSVVREGGGSLFRAKGEMDKQPKPLPSPQVLTNGDAEFHQEALRLSPLQPESILKKPLAPPIDMQANGCTGTEKQKGKRPNVSFSDELEEENSEPPILSLAESTKKRFAKERPLETGPLPEAAPLPLDAGPFAGAAPSLGQLCFGASQARGARPYMEDRHTILANYEPTGTAVAAAEAGVLRSFAGVYDGHNGSQTAEEAAARLHVLLAEERGFASCSGEAQAAERESTAMRDALERSFLRIDAEVLNRARAENARDGSCALVAVRIGGSLWTAHAGDCRAVLSRGRVAVPLTEDHKPGLERERARVEGSGGRVEMQRCWRIISTARGTNTGLAVSRSLGDLDFKEPSMYVECMPDVGRVQLLPEDSMVIMASDGLWDVLSDQQAVETAEETLKDQIAGKGHVSDAVAKEVSSALVMAALRKGTLDNVTVVILLLRWD